MTRVELARQLSAIDRLCAGRVEIWRVVVAPDGRIVKRIHRGSFTPTPGSRAGEPRKEDRS